MVNKTLIQNKRLIKDYQQYTDKYFLRSKQIFEAENINPIVRYQVFAREDIKELKGINEAVDFIKGVVGDKVKIYTLRDGQSYKAKEPIMKLEGHAQNLIDLETVYLEILSGRLLEDIDLNEARRKARAVVQYAKEKPVFYLGARHFAPELDEKIAKICQEEGFAGCSTDVGAKAWNAKGFGTVPHASILTYAAYMQENNIQRNQTVESAKGFDKIIDKQVPRIILVDTYNKEIDDSIATATAVPNLTGVRIDTCGENYAQGAKEIVLPQLNVNPKYLRGKGVKIAGVWALRKALDKKGFEDLEIIVSSGFNEKKTKAFIKADRVYQEVYRKPLFNSIGTGSIAKSISTTSDICAYFNENKGIWLPMSKVGRSETPSKLLREVK